MPKKVSKKEFLEEIEDLSKRIEEIGHLVTGSLYEIKKEKELAKIMAHNAEQHFRRAEQHFRRVRSI